MINTLLRKGGAVLLACFFLTACSKNAMSDELGSTRAAQRARTAEQPRPDPGVAPMPRDSMELIETRNPQDI